MSSPYINHFLQPDTLIPEPSNPQAWNRFSYVVNNPVNLNDPTGHRPCGDGEAIACNPDNSEKDYKKPTYGNGLIGPPEQELTYDLSSLRDVPSNTVLHPINVILSDKHTFGGYVPVYSADGNLFGYRVARYSADASTMRIDMGAINPGKYLKMSIDNIVTGQISKTVELLGSKAMSVMVKRLSIASNVYDFVSISNEVIVLDGHIEISGPTMLYPENITSFPDPNAYFGIPLQ